MKVIRKIFVLTSCFECPNSSVASIEGNKVASVWCQLNKEAKKPHKKIPKWCPLEDYTCERSEQI